MKYNSITRFKKHLACEVRSVAILYFSIACPLVHSESAPEGKNPATTSKETRSFYQGFTPFMLDNRAGRKEAVYDTVYAHADLIALHLDNGVPWQEAFDGTPYPKSVRKELDFHKQHLRKDQKVYLALNPLTLMRNNEAANWGGNWGEDWNETIEIALSGARPGEWAKKDFDHPDVIKAYTNQCRNMIEMFHPDFMGYGVEVNLLTLANPKAFAKFHTLIKEVYSVLKQENPDLPLFLTLQIDFIGIQSAHQLPLIRQLLPYSDYIAVSTYPYSHGYSVETLPDDWFDSVAALAPDKPFAITETGFIAEPLSAPPRNGKTDGKNINTAYRKGMWSQGSQQVQADYVERLLSNAQKLDARFVTWYFAHDIDYFWESLKQPSTKTMVIAWRDVGLVDENGKTRESMVVWDKWLAKPVEPRRK